MNIICVINCKIRCAYPTVAKVLAPSVWFLFEPREPPVSVLHRSGRRNSDKLDVPRTLEIFRIYKVRFELKTAPHLQVCEEPPKIYDSFLPLRKNVCATPGNASLAALELGNKKPKIGKRRKFLKDFKKLFRQLSHPEKVTARCYWTPRIRHALRGFLRRRGRLRGDQMRLQTAHNVCKRLPMR
jgi:hypothetical protein